MARKSTKIALPTRIISRKDVLKAARELEKIRDALIAARVNSKQQQPLLSDNVKALLEANEISELTSDVADNIITELEHAVDHVPMLRFTFAAEPDPEFMQRLVGWLRSELHPSALMLYSIQPQIAGGFILTTDNHRYNFSWRHLLTSQPELFSKVLRA